MDSSRKARHGRSSPVGLLPSSGNGPNRKCSGRTAREAHESIGTSGGPVAEGVRNVLIEQSVVLEFPVEGAAADTKYFGGLDSVAVALFQNTDEMLFFDFAEGFGGSSRCIFGFPKVFRKVAHFHGVVFRQDEGVFHHVFQFPDISRPGVVHQSVQDLGGDACDLFGRSLADFAQEVIGEKRKIRYPLPQGRQVNGNHVESIEDIFPKIPVFDLLAQVPRRGRHDAHIHLDRVFAADPLNLLELKNPQELYLGGLGNFTDLVEKNRTPVGKLETPAFQVARAGKSPSFVGRTVRFRGEFADRRRNSPGMNGPLLRLLNSWMRRATNSFPVPLSPWMSTVASESATLEISR